MGNPDVILNAAVEAALRHLESEHTVFPNEYLQSTDAAATYPVGTVSDVVREVIQAAAPFLRIPGPVEPNYDALRQEAYRMRDAPDDRFYVHDRYARRVLLVRADELERDQRSR